MYNTMIVPACVAIIYVLAFPWISNAIQTIRNKAIKKGKAGKLELENEILEMKSKLIKTEAHNDILAENIKRTEDLKYRREEVKIEKWKNMPAEIEQLNDFINKLKVESEGLINLNIATLNVLENISKSQIDLPEDYANAIQNNLIHLRENKNIINDLFKELLNLDFEMQSRPEHNDKTK